MPPYRMRGRALVGRARGIMPFSHRLSSVAFRETLKGGIEKI